MPSQSKEMLFKEVLTTRVRHKIQEHGRKVEKEFIFHYLYKMGCYAPFMTALPYNVCHMGVLSHLIRPFDWPEYAH